VIRSAARIQDLLWDSGFSRRCDRGELSGAEMHEFDFLGFSCELGSVKRGPSASRRFSSPARRPSPPTWLGSDLAGARYE